MTRGREKKPIVAICYDFDKTLTHDDMQAQGFIQEVGYDIEDFWKETNSLSKNAGMDLNLAYMYMMVEKAKGKLDFTKDELMKYGGKIKLFKGVDSWFSRIGAYARDNGATTEHYVISSGLREMIEGTAVAKEFKEIYAGAFYFDKKGRARWPAQAINYTNKTQFLFRISKGVLDINDEQVNRFFPPDEIRIPFRNIVYIGDSATDIPCMKLVNSYGGYSVGVYNPDTKDMSKVHQMMNDNRIGYYAPADYSAGGELERLIKGIIDKTVTAERLNSLHFKQQRQTKDYYMTKSEDAQKYDALIDELENSRSFASTHRIVAELNGINAFTADQRQRLCEAVIANSQVGYILGDDDIKGFYKKLLKGQNNGTYEEKTVSELLEQMK